MSNQMYIDPILKKYADLITGVNKEIKAVYYGDPIRIPASSLPALVLAKIDTSVSNHSNVEDLHRIRISFTVVTDVRETIGDDKTMVAGVNAMYNLMEGRTAGTYALRTDAILNILRTNVEVDSSANLRTDLDSMTRVDYGMTVGKRSEQGWSIEGAIEVTAHFIQVR